MYNVSTSLHTCTCIYGTDDLVLCVHTGLPKLGEGLGAGLDSCVLPTRHDGISIVQTTDLYPIV